MGYISINGAAELSGVGKQRLRNMLHSGELDGAMSPGGKRFRVSVFSLLHKVVQLPYEEALKLTADRERVPDTPHGFGDELLERRRWFRAG